MEPFVHGLGEWLFTTDGTRFLQRVFFLDNLLVRLHSIIDMIWWTGLAPWEFDG